MLCSYRSIDVCRHNYLPSQKMVHKNPKFDLNKKPADFCCNDEFNKDNHFDDTTLRLECFSQQDTKSVPNDGCRLVLGLGPSPSVCRNDRELVLKLCLSSYSKCDLNPVSNHQSAYVEVNNGFGSHHVDEGSTSAKSSGGYMPSLLLAPRISVPLKKLQISEPESSVASDFSTETASDHRTSGKKCEFSGCANRQVECGVWCGRSMGCREAARGKSGLCIKHGGGKRFVVDRCSRSGEGHVGGSHGGGKCYKFKKHTTSAHGSKDICKDHSGARRSIWGGQRKYDEFAGGRGGLHVARDSEVQEAEENKNGFPGITPRLIHGLVSGPVPGSPDNHSLSGSSVVSSFTSRGGNPAKRRQMIPPQVLVPSSMKSSSFLPSTRQSCSGTDNNGGRKSFGLAVPEGRVHGGSLLSVVTGNLRDDVIDGI